MTSTRQKALIGLLSTNAAGLTFFMLMLSGVSLTAQTSSAGEEADMAAIMAEFEAAAASSVSSAAAVSSAPAKVTPAPVAAAAPASSSSAAAVPAPAPIMPVDATILSGITWDKLTTIIPTMAPLSVWQNPISSTAIALGCFSKTGIWTEIRKECAEDQRAFVLHLTIETRTDDDVPGDAAAGPHPALTDERVRQLIEQQFVPAETYDAKKKALTSVVESVLGSLGTLEQHAMIPEDLSAAVRDHARTIRGFLSDIESASTASLDTRIAGVLREIDALKALIGPSVGGSADAVPPTNQEMETVVDRLSVLIGKLPAAENLLTSQGVTLPAEGMAAATEAMTQMQRVETACTSLSRCPPLAEAAKNLVLWRETVRVTVEAAGTPGILTQVESLMSAK